MAATTKNEGFSAAEKKAMKERATELKANQKKEKLEADLLTKVAEMTEEEQALATAIHEIATEAAPGLTAKTWYGMPAYANADGKVIFFFQAASKFDSRYSTLGFNDDAQLDDGSMWPTGYALTRLTPSDAKKVKALIRQAVGEG